MATAKHGHLLIFGSISENNFLFFYHVRSQLSHLAVVTAHRDRGEDWGPAFLPDSTLP